MSILCPILPGYKHHFEGSRRMVCDLQAYLNLHARDASLAAGRLPVDAPRTAPRVAPAPDRSLDGAHVYVQGRLCLDWAVYVDTTLEDFVASMQQGFEKIVKRWSFNGCQLGGFPAFAIRACRSKGAKVALGAVIPRDPPREFETFLEQNGVDCRYVERSGNGPVPQTLKLHFLDNRHLLLVDPGAGTYDVPPPASRFDARLINPGGAAARRKVLRALREDRGASGQPLGIVGRADWDREDWDLVRDSGFRVYLNRAELCESMRRLPEAARRSPQNGRQVEEHLKGLRPVVGKAAVTATDGASGSTVLSAGHLTRATAAAIRPVSQVGAGDTYAATATLSALAGASEGRTALRANMDAALLLSGQALASSLSELDREIARRPEMVETVLAL